jgi:branched-chain amino acid transport system ATP-binding protein
MTAGIATTQAVPTLRPALEIRGLSAGYGDLEAVRDVSMALYPGKVTALFGSNGAGKTTLLLAAMSVLPRLRGNVLVADKPSDRPLHVLARQGIMFVPCAPTVIKNLSVADNLRLGKGGIEAAVDHFPELGAILPRSAGLLSGGEQQMLSLARALAAEPRVLMIDEMSLGLAPLVVDRLYDTLRKAADEQQLAVLLVEQQARRALAVADFWYLLANGCVAASGVADDHALLEAAYLASMTADSTPEAPVG